jgi:hypothetical protein
MKVKDLIETLKNIDPEKEIVMSKDSEGNSFSPLADWCHGYYVPSTKWSGDLYNSKEEAVGDGIADDKALECVALWPTN